MISTRKKMLALILGFGIAIAVSPINGEALPSNPSAPPALSTVSIPEPPNLAEFVRDKGTAIRLGKALFWDMQVGSDGILACASCHFQAGADSRTKNQVTPGILSGDSVFGNNPFRGTIDYPGFGPNYRLTTQDFPLHKLQDVEDRYSPVLRDTNDSISSMGTMAYTFTGIHIASSRDLGVALADPVFNVAGIITRRVEPRNTPTVINAVFNFANFWDGRANFFFNGVNPFGPLDMSSGIFVNTGNTVLEKRVIRLPMASLASQAVGPPLSIFEMSFVGRSWPDVGRKMLQLRPLGKQKVHPHDSVLGPLARATIASNGMLAGLNGLNSTYEDLIRTAFRSELWNSDFVIRSTPGEPVIIPRPARPLAANEYTHMEANFSLFFGLAVQLYEATLIADDTPFDHFQEGDASALTLRQQEGLDIFLNQGRCINCHGGPELTNAGVTHLQIDASAVGFARELVEAMLMNSGELKNYDSGYYNIGVRPTAEDIGRGGDSPFINPLTGQPFPLAFTKLSALKRQGLLPQEVAQFIPASAELPMAVDGAMKAPSLRNVELTGPYFHNGDAGTLRQVVDFYARGGNFHDLNISNLDADIDNIGHLLGHPERKDALVDFLLALTDERVRQESAPFDHPELFVPHGMKGDQHAIIGTTDLRSNGFQDNEEVMEIPATGSGGRPASHLPAPEPFLKLSPFEPGNRHIQANDDSATTRAGIAVSINVLANDTVLLGTIDPATVNITAPPANGNVINNHNGIIQYTPAPGFSGTDTFTYTVRNNLGDVSNPATVTILVTSAEQAGIIVNYAEYIPAGSLWIVIGNLTTREAGRQITATLERTGQVLGSCTSSPTGSFTLMLMNSTVVPSPGDTIRLQSAPDLVVGNVPVSIN